MLNSSPPNAADQVSSAITTKSTGSQARQSKPIASFMSWNRRRNQGEEPGPTQVVCHVAEEAAQKAQHAQ